MRPKELGKNKTVDNKELTRTESEETSARQEQRRAPEKQNKRTPKDKRLERPSVTERITNATTNEEANRQIESLKAKTHAHGTELEKQSRRNTPKHPRATKRGVRRKKRKKEEKTGNKG
ncbi:hypothetical protein Tco_1534023 [Tanacetum coccineum]